MNVREVTMKLTIIGCWGGYPKVNEASAGYLLEHEGFHLLIDCGSGVLSKLPNFLPVEKLDAVILSHYHEDHIADIGVLQHARLIQSIVGGKLKTLPIYGHPFDENAFSKLTFKDITVGKAYDGQNPLTIGPFHIQFERTIHPAICFAMRIECDGKVLVFTGDTVYKDEYISFVKDCDLLLSECNFYQGMDGKEAGHMNSEEVGRLAAEGNVKKLVLTHLPQFGQVEKLVVEAEQFYHGPVFLAKYGETYEL